MSLTDIVKALAGHQYLALVIMVAAYVRKLCGPDSKFPVNLSTKWQPVASTAVGAVFGGLVAYKGGQSAGTAVLETVVAAGGTGLADMIVVAAFANPATAPGWAKVLCFLVDDLTGDSQGGSGGTSVSGGGSGGLASSSTAKTTAPSSKRTFLSWCTTMIVVGLIGAVIAAGGAVLAGCTPAQSATWSQVEQTVLADLENGVALDAIETAVAALVPAGSDIDAIINDVIQFLHDDHILPPNVEPVAQKVQAQIAAKKAVSK